MAGKRFDPNTPVYQLKITLLNIEPSVWRRFQTRQDITLYGLHDYIQGVMFGWKDYHLHEFEINGQRYGVPDHEYDDIPEMKLKNEKNYKLCQLSKPGGSFLYRYDLGDNWEHEIIVEKQLPPDPNIKYPLCLHGQRCCPPEDVGGPSGYEEFLEAISDPKHQEHKSWLDWVGSSFDPEAFDIKQVNNILGNIRTNTHRQS